MKNSTEFAGDLTLCLYCAGSVLYYRVRHTHDKRLTVDTDTTFSNVSLTVQYTSVLYSVYLYCTVYTDTTFSNVSLTSRLSMSASSLVDQLHRVGHFS